MEHVVNLQRHTYTAFSSSSLSLRKESELKPLRFAQSYLY